MRKWFVVFMLFLLPVRGLVGDAMAYNMLPAGLGGTAPHASSVVEKSSLKSLDSVNAVQASSNLPCHTNMATADSDAPAQSLCTSCQACHLGAMTGQQLRTPLLQVTGAAPDQQTTLWHSAEPRLIAKTPVL